MRLRYSLKTLFIVFTIVALLFASLGSRLNRARQQRLAVEALRAVDASVWYEAKYMYRHGPNVVGWVPRNWREQWDEWLAEAFGQDFIYEVDRVYLVNPSNGDVLRSVQRIPKLRELYLGKELSDEGWQALPQCRQIQKLIVERDQRTHTRRLTGLSALTQLRELVIEGGEFTVEDARAVADLTGLRSLELQLIATDDAALQLLVELKSLERFDLKHRGLGKDVTDEGVAFVADLPMLRSLTIARLPSITDGAIKYLEPMTQLESLNLDQASIRGTEFHRLTKLPNLKHLNLIGTAVDDDALNQMAAMRQLESLDLYGTQVTSVGLRHLSSLHNLKSLVIGNVTVTSEALSSLQQQLPRCKVRVVQ